MKTQFAFLGLIIILSLSCTRIEFIGESNGRRGGEITDTVPDGDKKDDRDIDPVGPDEDLPPAPNLDPTPGPLNDNTGDDQPGDDEPVALSGTLSVRPASPVAGDDGAYDHGTELEWTWQSNGYQRATLIVYGPGFLAQGSPSPSPWPSSSPSPTPYVSYSPSPTPYVSYSPSPTPYVSYSPSPTPYASYSPSPTPYVSYSPSPSPYASYSPSPSPSSSNVVVLRLQIGEEFVNAGQVTMPTDLLQPGRYIGRIIFRSDDGEYLVIRKEVLIRPLVSLQMQNLSRPPFPGEPLQFLARTPAGADRLSIRSAESGRTVASFRHLTTGKRFQSDMHMAGENTYTAIATRNGVRSRPFQLRFTTESSCDSYYSCLVQEADRACRGETKQMTVDLAIPSIKECSWSTDDNLDPVNIFHQALERTGAKLNLPAGAKLCGIDTIKTKNDRSFIYDDGFFFTVNNLLLATSVKDIDGLMSSKDEKFLHFDWPILAGVDFNSNGVQYCLGMDSDSSICQFPGHERYGKMKLWLADKLWQEVQADSMARGKNNDLNFEFAITGDNDANDCMISHTRDNTEEPLVLRMEVRYAE